MRWKDGLFIDSNDKICGIINYDEYGDVSVWHARYGGKKIGTYTSVTSAQKAVEKEHSLPGDDA